MGIKYDVAGGCWRVDHAFRVGNSVKHLKCTVRGAKKATEGAALRKLAELKERANQTDAPVVAAVGIGTERVEHLQLQPAAIKVRSLTFGDGVAKYLERNSHCGSGVSSMINHLDKHLGDVPITEFRDAFEDWINSESKRNRLVRKCVGGKVVLLDSGKRVSKSLIRNYKIYAKAIVRLMGHPEQFEGIVVGKPIVRRRPIEAWELAALEESCRKLYPWHYPALLWASRNPTRPNDQFTITTDNIKGGRVIYSPHKTYDISQVNAYPVIFPELQDWFDSIKKKGGLLFPRADGVTSMFDGKYYRHVWGKIRRDSGVNVQWYDLKHHAVAWMRSIGLDDWRIARAAGWSSTEQISGYDPDSRHLIESYDKKRNLGAL